MNNMHTYMHNIMKAYTVLAHVCMSSMNAEYMFHFVVVGAIGDVRRANVFLLMLPLMRPLVVLLLLPQMLPLLLPLMLPLMLHELSSKRFAHHMKS